MARSYTRNDVDTHGRGYYGNPLPAVNVKVRDTLEDGYRAFARWDDPPAGFTVEWIRAHVSDEVLDAIFWHVCENGWEQLQELAREIFGHYADVSAEGRSGGWAVVDGLDDLEDWDAIALARWRKFERLARLEADDVMRSVVESVYINEWEAAEAERVEAAGVEADVAEALASL